MRERFEKETHFETYAGESNISISANCSILLALPLNLKYDSNAVSAIGKVSEFLVAQWLNADRPIKDKWVILPHQNV